MKLRSFNPFRFMALRIFAWFWLVLLLTLGATWLLARGMLEDTKIRHLPHDIHEQLEPVFRTLKRADSIDELKTRLNRRERNRWLIVDPLLNSVLNSEILPRGFDQSWLTELSQLTKPRLLFHRHVTIAGPFIIQFKEQPLVLYQIRPRARPAWHDPINLPPYLLPGLLVLVSALASFILALTITKPLRLLQQKNLDFAAGDLNARANAPARRNDEIGELSRGFNLMAAKIGDLLQNQQRLLRDVSHELRSPLTRAQLAIALEQRQGGGTQLPRLQQELERVDQLLGELLTFSRLDAGQVQLQRLEVDLHELIEEIITVNQLEADQKQLIVTLTGPNPCPFYIEPKLLARAIENILRNAIKYSPDAARISFVLSQSATETKVVIIDQGPGIPAASLEQIFEPFYRVSDSRNSQTGGTGLGLAIAAQVVRQHGGQIVASLPDDGGFCVTITLPQPALSA